MENGMDFGDALEAMRNGDKVCRAGWNGKGMYLGIAVPMKNGAKVGQDCECWHGYLNNLLIVDQKMDLPYIYMVTVDGTRVPWLASQTDMLAEDWDIAGTHIAEDEDDEDEYDEDDEDDKDDEDE